MLAVWIGVVALVSAKRFVVIDHRVGWKEASATCRKHGYDLAAVSTSGLSLSGQQTMSDFKELWVRPAQGRPLAGILNLSVSGRPGLRHEQASIALKLPVLCKVASKNKDVFLEDSRRIACHRSRRVCLLRKGKYPRCKYLCPLGADILGTAKPGIGFDRPTYRLHGPRQPNRKSH